MICNVSHMNLSGHMMQHPCMAPFGLCFSFFFQILHIVKLNYFSYAISVKFLRNSYVPEGPRYVLEYLSGLLQ
jgi:hypothetical protein